MSEPLFTDKCCPTDWLDEVLPSLGASPNDFLCMHNGHIWLVGLDDREEFLAGKLSDEDWSDPGRVLAVGDEVAFMFTRTDFPKIRFRVLDDGAITLTDPVPDGANLFGCGMAFVIKDDPLVAARALLEEDETEREIKCWYWSSSVTHVVSMDAAGVPYFERKRAAQ